MTAGFCEHEWKPVEGYPWGVTMHTSSKTTGSHQIALMRCELCEVTGYLVPQEV